MTAWLFTFAVHSTLWCALAWVWTRARPSTSARARETLWYTALAASLVTPTVQSLTASQAAVWRVTLPAVFSHGAASEHAAPAAANARGPWDGIVPAAWFGVAAFLLLAYHRRLERLRDRLGTRAPLESPTARRALARLSRRAGLQAPPLLTQSEHLGSPVALGVGARREICVPVRALQELDSDQFEALLGHELAHHLRRDTVWLAVLNAFQAVFFFQPLFRLAARDLRAAAEEQCDDWAASRLDDRLAMASCLAEVAAWTIADERGLPVPCMARRQSPLRTRVDRLLDPGRELELPRDRAGQLCATGLLLVSPLFAPAVALSSEPSRERGDGQEREHQNERHGDEHGRS